MDTSDFKKGLKFMLDGQPYVCVDFQFVKPGKGQAFTRTKMKNMLTGGTIERNIRSGEKLEAADVEKKILPTDPFDTLDQVGVGNVIRTARRLGVNSLNWLGHPKLSKTTIVLVQANACRLLLPERRTQHRIQKRGQRRKRWSQRAAQSTARCGQSVPGRQRSALRRGGPSSAAGQLRLEVDPTPHELRAHKRRHLARADPSHAGP